MRQSCAQIFLVSHPSEEWGLFAPATEVPAKIPTETRVQRLPFEDLTWENFERLCHRLASTEANVEQCARFGVPGQAQSGIDIYARYPDLTYHCWQAKRHRTFGPSAIRKAVDMFLAGDWASKCSKFTLATQTALGDTKAQLEIEKQAARLRADGITFFAQGGVELTESLRQHPKLVDDFFGRAWVVAFLGDEAVRLLRGRLDGEAHHSQ